jgi:hypothetical protein
MSIAAELQAWQALENCLETAAARLRLQSAGAADDRTRLAALSAEIQDVQELISLAETARAPFDREREFLGLNWGVGLGFGWSDKDRIEQAEIVNNLISVRKETTQQARVFLEYHWFPEQWQNNLGRTQSDRIVRAHGPFIAVAARDDKILSGVGVGWMVGFRDESKANGFAVAAGAMLDNDVTTLADGFKEGQPPPTGQTEVKFKSESELSYVLFFTRTF